MQAQLPGARSEPIPMPCQGSSSSLIQQPTWGSGPPRLLALLLGAPCLLLDGLARQLGSAAGGARRPAVIALLPLLILPAAALLLLFKIVLR